MTRYHIYFLLVLLSWQVQIAFSQCHDNAFENLDANQVVTRFNNGGNFFWDMAGLPVYEVPRGSGLHTAFSGALWVGGLDPVGELHVAASTYRQAGWEWYAGPARRTQAYACPTSLETASDIMYNGIKRLRNGKVLILTTDEVLIYDDHTRQLQVRPLPAPRVWVGAIELPDGRIMLMGDDLYPTKNPILFMDTVNYAITGGPTLQWFHQESSINVLRSGKVLIAGVVGCEIFDPATNISTIVPDMLWARMKHATVMLPNGNVMAFGGGASLNGLGLTIVTQYFDDSLGYWFPGPTMSVGRQRAMATWLPDGKLFISGGTSSSKLTDIYDPVTNTITTGPALPEFANAHSVALLDSHRIVIASEKSASDFEQLYSFDLYTGAHRFLNIQRSGPRMLLLDSSEVLLQVEDLRHLQRLHLDTGIQDDDRWQYIWKVSRTEIDQFRADFLANNVDFARYPPIAHWPAHGDEGLGEDRNLAPFVDVNGDGRYRPAIDGDYPCIVGDQGIWWVFNDQGPHAESGGKALGLQVEAMAYAIDCRQSPCPDSSLDYTIFLHYEITNHSDTAYHDMYVGNLQDYDIGQSSNDYMASDSSLGLSIGYNSPDMDANYGQHPPAWGSAVMPNGQLGTMASSMFYENTIGAPNSIPQVPADFYNYMRSYFRDSTHMVNNGLTGHIGAGPGPRTNSMYSSTDGFCGGQLTGWSEFGAGNPMGDRSFLQSSGPFSLQPSEKIQWDLAFIFARDSSNLLSVCKLKSATAAIRDWWQNQLDRSCFNTIVVREEPSPGAAFKVYPNPSATGQVQLDFGLALEESGALEVMDVQGRALKRLGLEAGVVSARLDVQHLPAGIYLLRLHAGARVATQRVILQ
jgi:hypothetical protein